MPAKIELTDEERKERQREWTRQYRERNREALNEKAKEKMRAHRAANPGSAAEACRKWYAKNRDAVTAQRRAGWSEIREEANAKRREHHRDHKDDPGQREAKMQRHYKARAVTPWLKFLNGAKQRALKKGVPFTLTREWMAGRGTGRCEITGIPFDTSRTTRGPAPFCPSLDRIKPELGYTPDNCRFVLWAVNALKGEATDAEMLLVAKAIVKAFSDKSE